MILLEDAMHKTGNVRHLLVLISCCLMAASSIGVYTNSVGVFYTTVSADLGVGRGAFALHATLCALATGFLSPLSARLMKKIRFRILIVTGRILAAASTALMSLARTIVLFYALGILRGIGLTCFYIMPVTTLINNWFRKHHGTAVGIALSFSGLAGAVFSPLFSALITSSGWQTSFLWMAGIGFALTIPAMLTVSFRPEDAGLVPYGISETAAVANNNDLPRKAPGKIYLPAMVFLCLMTIMHTSVTAIAQHFPGMGEWMGYEASVGAVMVSAGMIGNIVTKLLIGTLSDRFGPFRASISMILINAAALAGLTLFRGAASWVIIGICFLYGSVYSVGAVGIPLLTRTLFGTENYASAYAVVSVFTCVGSALALTIVGLVYDLTGGYTAALAGGIGIDLINLVILLILMGMHRKRTTLF